MLEHQFDHKLLVDHLNALQNGESVNIPIYDHSQHTRSDKTRLVGYHQIIIIEGIMLFVDKKLREMMDIKIFMDTALDICLIRRLKRDISERGRDIDEVLTRYQTTLKPMHEQFIEPMKEYADIIIPNNKYNTVAVDIVRTIIHNRL